MSKHTLGPWKAIEIKGGHKKFVIEANKPIGYEPDAGNKAWIAEVHNTDLKYQERGETIANAKLMAAAPEGQKRPRLGESADLVRNAIFMRLRQTRVPSSWEYAHVRLMLPVRLVTGVWLVFLTAILYGYGRGGWWGALLVPAAALHFYIAYRLIHAPDRAPGPARRERR